MLLEHAVRRGEVPDRTYPPGLVTLPFDLFRHDLTMTLARVPERRVPERRILEIVDDIWLPLLTRGARAAGVSRTPLRRAGRRGGRRGAGPAQPSERTRSRTVSGSSRSRVARASATGPTVSVMT